MRLLASLAAVSALALSAPVLAHNHGNSHAGAAHSAAETLAQVLASPIRDADRARDVHRHPAETLTFFDVQPGMTVVDFMPSGGWFTRVLVPYLGAEGTYIGLNPTIPDDATGFMANMRNYAETLPGQAQGWVPAGGARVIEIGRAHV